MEKDKECKICGMIFTPRNANQKYCRECGNDPAKAKRQMEIHMRMSVARVGNGYVPAYGNTCRMCGKSFISFGASAEFCSHECRTAHKLQETKCLYCGKSMAEAGMSEPSPTYRWYCSEECREKYAWKKAREEGRVKKCPECGKEFLNNKDQVYCSRTCLKAAQDNKRNIGRYGEIPPLVTARCSICGKLCSFDPHRIAAGVRPYCSDGCREVLRKKAENMQRRQAALRKAEDEKKEGKQKRIARADKPANAAVSLCTVCKTPYRKCDLMTSGFQTPPEGAEWDGHRVSSCPKYTAAKVKA